MIEKGIIIKQRGRHLHTGLFFPGPYEAAMSSLAYQSLYSFVNNLSGVLCDRFIVETGRSIEHNLEFKDIKVAFITAPFILNAPDVIKLCHYGLLPHHEIRAVCVGGVAVAANPGLFKFSDAVVFPGTIESHTEHINMIFKMVKAGYSRKRIIETVQPLADRVDMVFKDPGPLEYEPPRSIIYSDEAEFANMHLIEISRGCKGNCNFCLSKHLYAIYREFEYDSIIRAIDLSPPDIKTIGLIGDAVLSHSRIADIVDYIIYRKKRPAFASIRIADLTSKKISLILKSNIKTLTIAPEVATERLMRVTNKFYDKNMLFDALKELIANGVMNIKLYMMIGLPSETMEDIGAMIDFIREVREVLIDSSRNRGRLGTLKVTINNFVPSPFTPLFIHNPDSIENLEKKHALIKTSLSGLPNLTISTMDIFDTLYQTALFRTDYKYVRRVICGGSVNEKERFEQDSSFADDILRLCYK